MLTRGAGFQSMPVYGGWRVPGQAPPASARLARRLARGADLGGEQVGLFPGGEVAALVDLVVADELVAGREAAVYGATWHQPSRGTALTRVPSSDRARVLTGAMGRYRA
jgi:hypothetical protein